jgi:hypothetical protein
LRIYRSWIVASLGGGGVAEISAGDCLRARMSVLPESAPMKISIRRAIFEENVPGHRLHQSRRCGAVDGGSCAVGSDAPPLTSLKPRAIRLIRDLDIPAADKEKIFWSNARRLLKLN